MIGETARGESAFISGLALVGMSGIRISESVEGLLPTLFLTMLANDRNRNG